jgi:hypothetical protein
LGVPTATSDLAWGLEPQTDGSGVALDADFFRAGQALFVQKNGRLLLEAALLLKSSSGKMFPFKLPTLKKIAQNLASSKF